MSYLDHVKIRVACKTDDKTAAFWVIYKADRRMGPDQMNKMMLTLLTECAEYSAVGIARMLMGDDPGCYLFDGYFSFIAWREAPESALVFFFQNMTNYRACNILTVLVNYKAPYEKDMSQIKKLERIAAPFDIHYSPVSFYTAVYAGNWAMAEYFKAVAGLETVSIREYEQRHVPKYDCTYEEYEAHHKSAYNYLVATGAVDQDTLVARRHSAVLSRIPTELLRTLHSFCMPTPPLTSA